MTTTSSFMSTCPSLLRTSVVLMGGLLGRCQHRPSRAAERRRARCSTFDELLTTVDVEGGAGDRLVGHEVDRQGRDVDWADDASDGQRGAELLAPSLEPIAEERRRQGCVDE